MFLKPIVYNTSTKAGRIYLVDQQPSQFGETVNITVIHGQELRLDMMSYSDVVEHELKGSKNEWKSFPKPSCYPHQLEALQQCTQRPCFRAVSTKFSMHVASMLSCCTHQIFNNSFAQCKLKRDFPAKIYFYLSIAQSLCIGNLRCFILLAADSNGVRTDPSFSYAILRTAYQFL